MEHRPADDKDVLIALEHLAEAEHSDRLENLRYLALALPLAYGVDDPLLL